MKKIVLFLIIEIIILSNAYAQENDVWMFPQSSYFMNIYEIETPFDYDIVNRLDFESMKKVLDYYPYFVCDGNDFYINEGLRIGETRISLSELKTDANRYQKYLDNGTYETAIFGGDFFATTRNNKSYYQRVMNDLEEIRFLALNDRLDDFHEDTLFDYYSILPQVIKGIKMSAPFLRETVRGEKVVYDDDILKYRWFYKKGPRVAMYFINDSTPMVEGSPGNGVGTKIDICFNIPVDNLVVLNGFVDIERQHLYRKNARMKAVLVSGEGFEFEYTFEDYVHFAQIDFPKDADSVRLTVIDVYDGENWDDMAISGLWVNPDILHTRNSELAKEYLKEAEQRYEEQ